MYMRLTCLHPCRLPMAPLLRLGCVLWLSPSRAGVWTEPGSGVTLDRKELQDALWFGRAGLMQPAEAGETRAGVRGETPGTTQLLRVALAVARSAPHCGTGPPTAAVDPPMGR